MSNDFMEVVIHHGGDFFNSGKMSYNGEISTLSCDPDKWGLFLQKQ